MARIARSEHFARISSVKNIFMKVSKDSPSANLAFSSVNVRKNKNNFGKSVIETNGRSLVVSDFRSETKGSRFESGC